MWAGITASGTTPSRASNSSRRGLWEARIRRMTRCPSLFEAIGNPTLGQIIRGQLDEHLVAGQHANPVLAHLAGGVAEDFVAVLELHAEHGVGQQLDHLPAHLEEFFLGHPNPWV